MAKPCVTTAKMAVPRDTTASAQNLN